MQGKHKRNDISNTTTTTTTTTTSVSDITRSIRPTVLIVLLAQSVGVCFHTDVGLCDCLCVCL